MGRKRNPKGIVYVEPFEDYLGNHIIPYCDYYHHRGVLNEDKFKRCIRRNCRYLIIFKELEHQKCGLEMKVTNSGS